MFVIFMQDGKLSCDMLFNTSFTSIVETFISYLFLQSVFYLFLLIFSIIYSCKNTNIKICACDIEFFQHTLRITFRFYTPCSRMFMYIFNGNMCLWESVKGKCKYNMKMWVFLYTSFHVNL